MKTLSQQSYNIMLSKSMQTNKQFLSQIQPEYRHR